MSRTGFGRKTMRDPTFVFELEDGREPRIDTVDKLLVKMGHEPVGARFVAEVGAFLAVTGMKRSEFSREVNRNRSFATWLLNGGLPRLGTVDKASAVMAGETTPAQREAIRAAVEDGAPAVPVGREDEGEIEMIDDGYMSTEEAAAFLKLSPRTLQAYRGNGKGPPFSRMGNRARYLRSKVADWAAAREARSTTEADEKEREERVAAAPRDKKNGKDTGKEDGR